MSLLTLHNPVDVTEQLATLDAATGWRAVLCAMLRHRELECCTFGLDWSTCIARFQEAIRLVSELSSGSTVVFDGEVGFKGSAQHWINGESTTRDQGSNNCNEHVSARNTFDSRTVRSR